MMHGRKRKTCGMRSMPLVVLVLAAATPALGLECEPWPKNGRARLVVRRAHGTLEARLTGRVDLPAEIPDADVRAAVLAGNVGSGVARGDERGLRIRRRRRARRTVIRARIPLGAEPHAAEPLLATAVVAAPGWCVTALFDQGACRQRRSRVRCRSAEPSAPADVPALHALAGTYDGTHAGAGRQSQIVATDPPSPFDARSDGYVWTCSDVQDDGVHPSPPTPGPGPADGEFKTGDQLMAFFRTDVTATPWFLRSTSGGPTIVSLTANGQNVTGGGTITGAAPFSVDFAVAAAGAVHEVVWTYDDGTFSFNPLGTSNGQPYFDHLAAPHKVFKSPGAFDVRVHVSDPSGNVTLAGVTVEVTGGTLCSGGAQLALSRFAGTSTALLTWCAEPSADSFNVYRGSRPDLGDLACFSSDLTSATTTDADPLPPGSLRVYLVTSVSGGVESGLGNASNGQPRVNPAPCP
jgi:hypothetical protein